jgi:hypothetical protein
LLLLLLAAMPLYVLAILLLLLLLFGWCHIYAIPLACVKRWLAAVLLAGNGSMVAAGIGTDYRGGSAATVASNALLSFAGCSLLLLLHPWPLLL